MEKSPSLPPAEFRDEDNATSFASVERVNGELQLKRRPRFTQHGSITYCLTPDSPPPIAAIFDMDQTPLLFGSLRTVY